jgi:methanogenic corrinoid protein MtbC1
MLVPPSAQAAITQYVIATVYPNIVSSEPSRGRMVVTGVSGELHQIGANLVADAMESRGWSVQFLGSNIPHDSIVHAVEESSAEVLCISTTIVANLLSAAELIRSVRARLGGRAPRIVLGGAAYRYAANFAEEVGSLSLPTDLRAALVSLCG